MNCDAVDCTSNIDNRKRSATLSTFPITTKESLKAFVSHYVDIESKLPINKDVYNKLNFNVLVNDNKIKFGSIPSELYIIKYMDIELEQGLRHIYYNPKTGYQSAERLCQKAFDEGIPVTRNQVKSWSKSQHTPDTKTNC